MSYFTEKKSYLDMSHFLNCLTLESSCQLVCKHCRQLHCIGRRLRSNTETVKEFFVVRNHRINPLVQKVLFLTLRCHLNPSYSFTCTFLSSISILSKYLLENRFSIQICRRKFRLKGLISAYSCSFKIGITYAL